MATQAGTRFFYILLTVAVVLVAMVARPIVSGLFVAAVFTGVLWPWHQRLSKRLGGRRSLSALIWVLGVVLLILGPTVAFSTVAVREAVAGWHFLTTTLKSEGVEGLVARLPDFLERIARFALQHVPVAEAGDLADQVGAQSTKAAAAVAATLSATGSLLFQAVMMLIALYFLLLEGDTFVAWLDDLLPLAPGQTRELLLEFKRTSLAVIVSTGVTAGVQAAAALVGYLIAGVPHPVFFACVTFFVAFIPAVGAGAAGLVAALILYVTGHSYAAIFLAAWALLVVGLVDNLVKPILIKRGMEMRGAVVFFSLIGGLAAFGSVGLLLGPLVVAFFLALLRMYERDFKAGKGPRHAH
jgi:predicted PurR-regulated permease PerM